MLVHPARGRLVHLGQVIVADLPRVDRVSVEVRARRQDDRGRDDNGEEEDEEQDAVEHEANLLPLEVKLLACVRLGVAELGLVNRHGQLAEHAVETGVVELLVH